MKKKKTYWQKLKVANNISFAIMILMILGLFWYVDAKVEFPETWTVWFDELFWLLEFVIIIAYYAVIILVFEIIHRGIKVLVRAIMGL